MKGVFVGSRPDLLLLLSKEISHGEQAALLGIAAGLSTESELEILPGMAAVDARRAAIQSLLARGWVEEVAGRLVLRISDLRPTKETLRAVSRRKKIWAILAFLSGSKLYYKLAARGYTGMTTVLSEVEQACLLNMLEWVERQTKQDRRRTRRLRTARLAFVLRRVPLEYLDPRLPARPRRAPHDVRERMLSIFLRGCGNPAERASLNDRVDLLYEHLFVYGEEELAHGWRIVQAIGERDLGPAQRWDQACLRIAARTVRRGLPDILASYRAHEPRQLVTMYPVPDCGYGPWVEDELALYGRFSRRYAGATGQRAVRSLWVRAHRIARVSMADDDRLTTDPAWEAEYQRRLYEAADEMTASAVGGGAGGAVEMWDAYEWRCLFRRIARYAQDDPPGRAPREKRRTVEDLGAPRREIDLTQASGRDWAPRLLRLILHRRMGWSVDPGAWDRALAAAREKLTRVRKCKAKWSPSVQARRLWMLHAPMLEAESRNAASPDGVERVVDQILTELGFGRERTSPDAREAHRALEQCAYRSGIRLVIVDGPLDSAVPVIAGHPGDSRGVFAKRPDGVGGSGAQARPRTSAIELRGTPAEASPSGHLPTATVAAPSRS